MRIITTLKITLCLGLVMLLSACATTPDELVLLDKSFFAYERALRWQDFDVVIAFHKNERNKLTEEKRKYLKQFRITAYNIVYSKVEADSRHASQVVELKYYNTAVATVKDLTINNEWVYDEKATRWQLTNDFPDFK